MYKLLLMLVSKNCSWNMFWKEDQRICQILPINFWKKNVSEGILGKIDKKLVMFCRFWPLWTWGWVRGWTRQKRKNWDENLRVRGFLVNDQNLLSMAKVTCCGSLSGCLWFHLNSKVISKSSSSIQM